MYIYIYIYLYTHIHIPEGGPGSHRGEGRLLRGGAGRLHREGPRDPY